jgi:protein-disulfide isomerase
MTTADTPTLKPPASEHDHMRGPDGAPVTLVEYGDYEYPHCRQVAPIIKQLRVRFGDRLCYVFRHFPITTAHPYAQLTAEAAEAAAAQGKFWDMHDRIFGHTGPLNRQQLVQFAQEPDLDIARFERELDEHVYADQVREDFLSGVRSGANGTPTFFLNGVRYDGPWDLDSLIAEIEEPLGVQVRLISQRFTRLQASGGILLLVAAAIAGQLGLNGASQGGGSPAIMTGRDVTDCCDEELMEGIEQTAVFARVSPEQKLRLVEALQARHHIVSMTGDGVNDGPALKQADVGTAMGITGTDVAKEAADMVLIDDNFASIEAAVEEGRGVFDNLTKIIAWTLPTNLGEGLIILLAILSGVTLPILPIHILWINMTTVGVLGIVLALSNS